jgi:hypothetical protein
MEVIFQNPKLKRWIALLEHSTSVKVVRMIALLEEWGSELGLPYSKSLGRGLFELRIYGDQPVRIFYAFHQNRAVLLHGCIKRSNRFGRYEMETAWQRKNQLD